MLSLGFGDGGLDSLVAAKVSASTYCSSPGSDCLVYTVDADADQNQSQNTLVPEITPCTAGVALHP
jgi:hypothetical protein